MSRRALRTFPLRVPPRTITVHSLYALVGLSVLLLSGGCRRGSDVGSRAGSPAERRATYVDGLGRSVSIPLHPQRIISLAPSVTEVLYLLGVQDRTIGVTTHCDWPDDARNKKRIGTLLNPDYELILSLKPDLVIASTAGNDQAAVLKLAQLGLPVFVTAPRSFAKISETVESIGRIAGADDRGRQMAGEMRSRIAEICRRIEGLPPVKAFFITWFEPLLAPGKNTFETDVLRLVNVQSITADVDAFYPRYSLEQVIARDPDAILTVRHPGFPLPDLKQLNGWKSLRAVRQGRVFALSETLQHPSPRVLEGLEELARRLHPERFP